MMSLMLLGEKEGAYLALARTRNEPCGWVNGSLLPALFRSNIMIDTQCDESD